MIKIIALIYLTVFSFAYEESYSINNVQPPIETMKAIVCDGHGGPEVLKVVERPIPVPKEDEVLIKVKYSAMNRADIMQRRGLYPAPKGATDILGLEVSGYELKSEKRKRVIALLPGGGYAPYVVAKQDHVIELPDYIELETAAAITEVWVTAF